MFKNLVRIFLEKICKTGFLEGGGVSVLYIGRTVPNPFAQRCLTRFFTADFAS
jgi:hypothetical protein